MELPPTYRSPFDDHVGCRLVEAGPDRVVAELKVSQRHHQPDGVVHGGVYAAMVETAASVGANLWLAGSATAVGVANSTDFLKGVPGGTLRAEALPVQRGRSLQLWRVLVTDDGGVPAASGTVRLMNLRR
jgi:1,4-dihydroxy-2-naphthoyl-CoA hydrolase